MMGKRLERFGEVGLWMRQMALDWALSRRQRVDLERLPCGKCGALPERNEFHNKNAIGEEGNGKPPHKI